MSHAPVDIKKLLKKGSPIKSIGFAVVAAPLKKEGAAFVKMVPVIIFFNSQQTEVSCFSLDFPQSVETMLRGLETTVQDCERANKKILAQMKEASAKRPTPPDLPN